MPNGALLPRQTGHGPYPFRVTMFALVHGAWHGAWCWEKVTPLLQQAGHDVVAPDLPCDDGSADFDTYADMMCSALQGCDDDVVVVGHSLGGPTATLVAARRPARHLVYLCAVVPEAGLSLIDQGLQQITAEFANGWLKGLSEPDEQGRTVWVDLTLCERCSMPTGRTHRGSSDRSPATPGRLPMDAPLLADRTALRPLYLRCLRRRSGGQPRVVEANRRPHRRRHRRAARQSFTASFTTVGGG
jgi:pimeloyl-ACP methyl ester carboxylesterase